MISTNLAWPGFVRNHDASGIVDARIETVRHGEGRIDHTLTLRVSRKAGSEHTRQIGFAVDAPFEVPDLKTADPFLIAALFPAMEVGGTLRLHGTISRVLLRNILDYQAAWFRAAPNLFRPFELQVDAISDEVERDFGPRPNAILAFSGGMDSLLALHRNISGDAGEAAYAIGATMFLPGMAREDPTAETNTALVAGMRAMSGRRNLPMAVVDTNIADIVGKQFVTHGTWLASCLSLFGGRFDVGLLGSSVASYSHGYEIYGSHPLLDPFLSGGQMEIRNDEGLFKRPDKAFLLAKYPEALADLRTCFHYYDNDRNCCRCEKCIRTMLCFIATGNEIPPSFPDGLDLNDIGIGMGRRSGLEWAPLLLSSAEAHGASDHPAMRRLRQRYRQKRLKIIAKDGYRRVIRGQKPHRWSVLDQME